MKWIVGLDLKPQSASAIQFATWLCQTAGVDPKAAVQGVHVVEPEVLVELTHYATVAQVEGSARSRAQKSLEDAAIGQHLADPVVVSGRTVENVLEAATLLHGADALIIGRRGASTGFVLSRLGGFARRLLRRLQVPLVVVPPDLIVSKLGDGPVLCGVDLAEDCVPALRFAEKMAIWLRRDLLVAYFCPAADPLGYGELMPQHRYQEMSAEFLERGRKDLDGWLAQHRITNVQKHVGRGPVIPELAQHASDVKAPIIVLGSRRMTLLRRIVMPSVASEVAGAAAVPVAVVAPPDEDA